MAVPAEATRFCLAISKGLVTYFFQLHEQSRMFSDLRLKP